MYLKLYFYLNILYHMILYYIILCYVIIYYVIPYIISYHFILFYFILVYCIYFIYIYMSYMYILFLYNGDKSEEPCATDRHWMFLQRRLRDYWQKKTWRPSQQTWGLCPSWYNGVVSLHTRTSCDIMCLSQQYQPAWQLEMTNWPQLASTKAAKCSRATCPS